MSTTAFVEIPSQGRRLIAWRCGEADVLVLSDWCDMHLGRDYFFRRRHIEQILKRESNAVYAILVDGIMAGLFIMYRGSVLHNFYLGEEFRAGGIGRAILSFFMPQRVRSKTNMLAGDPTEFYKKCGYICDQPDPERPHIIDMVLPLPFSPPPAGEVARTAGDAPALAQCNGAANMGAAEPHIESNELITLRKKEANRERARLYRIKKKEQDAARAQSSLSYSGNGIANVNGHILTPQADHLKLFDPLA